MTHEKGTMSVHTQNIFPVIKKWLYSDKDIFLRELVSNGTDAIQKLKRLAALGEAVIPEGIVYSIEVILDKEKKIIQITDNGIGMTVDEIKKYINQVAFSGAEEFLSKYMDSSDESGRIIGHFGLGFYSAFMVSDKVEIDTRSYIEGAQAVKWSCAGGTEYEMVDSERSDRGTTVTLHIAETSVEFLDYFKLSEILRKYCYFLPVDIYLKDFSEGAKKEGDNEAEKPINDKYPLWLKKPVDITVEEYKSFYGKVFNDFNEPLFWIHLNVDYPFNLKGILYFPKIRHELDSIEGRVKLYCNQVFVADNIKEVIPEFLLLLKGMIDCPDLPLNVSRSFLQNDGYVRKISNHISKKVSDKLVELFKDKRDEYNRFWDDLNPFIKYGCMRDDKFYDRVKDIIMYKTIDAEYLTLDDFIEKHGDNVFYVADENQQAQYINIFKRNSMSAIVLPTVIDRHFIQFIEFKNKKVKFSRIDSDISEALKTSEQNDAIDTKWLEDIFKGLSNNAALQIRFESLKASEVPAMIIISEQTRRMRELGMQFGMRDESNSLDDEKTLVINLNNELIKALSELRENEDKKPDLIEICEVVYNLAVLGHGRLDPDNMTSFLQKSSSLLARVIKQ